MVRTSGNFASYTNSKCIPGKIMINAENIRAQCPTLLLVVVKFKTDETGYMTKVRIVESNKLGSWFTELSIQAQTKVVITDN